MYTENIKKKNRKKNPEHQRHESVQRSLDNVGQATTKTKQQQQQRQRQQLQKETRRKTTRADKRAGEEGGGRWSRGGSEIDCDDVLFCIFFFLKIVCEIDLSLWRVSLRYTDTQPGPVAARKASDVN